MRWMLILPALIFVGSAGASTGPSKLSQQQAADQQKLAALLEGFSPVETNNCVSERTLNGGSDRVGDTILYRVSPKLIYRNDTSGGCFGLAQGDILVTRSYGGNLCRGDIASTVDPASRISTGSCALGSFTTYRKK